MDQLLQTWELLDEQLAAVKARIDERQPQQETAVLLRSIPGVSAYSSLALACRLSDSIERFPTAASLANYWGLTPGCRNSGDATQRLGSITKAGSPHARRILGQLVLHVLRKDKWLNQWYQRIKQRRGSKIARVAVMRRLATIIWHMLKRKVPYVDGGPQRVQAAQAALSALAG
jgi:transposase